MLTQPKIWHRANKNWTGSSDFYWNRYKMIISISFFLSCKKLFILGFLLFFSQEQQTVVAEHLNVLYGELIGLLDHPNQDIQSQVKRALRSIFAFRMMYTTWLESEFINNFLKKKEEIFHLLVDISLQNFSCTIYEPLLKKPK